MPRIHPTDFDPARWIAWEGGPCPVDAETLVDVKWNNGAVSRCARADVYSGGEDDLWLTLNPRCRIVGYRLSPEPPASLLTFLEALEGLRDCLIRHSGPTCEVRRNHLELAIGALEYVGHTFDKFHASAIEAGTVETEGLDAQHESAVGKAETP